MIFFLPCTYSPWASSFIGDTRVRSFIGDGSARVHKTRSRGRHARKRETGRGTRDRGDGKSGRGAGTAPSIKTNNAFAAVIILFYSFAVIFELFKMKISRRIYEEISSKIKCKKTFMETRLEDLIESRALVLAKAPPGRPKRPPRRFSAQASSSEGERQRRKRKSVGS